MAEQQAYFERIAAWLDGATEPDEIFLANLAGEVSDFIRFNGAKVRQAGSVSQQSLGINLIQGRRQVSVELPLSGDWDTDQPRLRNAVETLRELRAQVPEDPYLLYATAVRDSLEVHEPPAAATAEVLDALAAAGGERDLVGIYAAGPVFHGFANSLGQRNWHQRYSFHLDWSCYLDGDKAVKSSHAGAVWDGTAFAAKLAAADRQLTVLGRAPKTIAPGGYRVYLAPAAVNEITTMLAWGGFGLRAHRTRTTPLLRMVEEGARLHPEVTLLEHTATGFAPPFQEQGFLRPPRVELIREGAYGDCLVAPRSALEYGMSTNGAGAGEEPLSLEMMAGRLAAAEVLRALGTGVYVGNLWYLNYSDRSACRLTGMTRFATFWVEDGEIVAPLSVMRFDDSIYRMLGSNLLGLTAERELILDSSTYEARSVASARLPGALIEDFRFTL